MAEYTGLNFLEVQNLDFDEFALLSKDAFVYQLEQSDAGREYLEKAWMMKQTKPDRQALREKFKREEGK